MKKLLAAVSLAAVVTPVAAADLSDLPDLADAPTLKHMGVDYPFGGTPAYNAPEDLALRVQPTVLVQSGTTRSDVEIAVVEDPEYRSPWANDHNFIAPPQ